MDWYFICPKCGKSQDTIGIQLKEITVCRATFKVREGKIEIIETYHYDTVDSEFDTYYCIECGANLTEEEFKEGIKKWLKKSGNFPEAVLKQLE